MDNVRIINALSAMLKESQWHAVRGIPPKKCELERAAYTGSFYRIYRTTLGVSLIPGSHFSLVFSLHLWLLMPVLDLVTHTQYYVEDHRKKKKKSVSFTLIHCSDAECTWLYLHPLLPSGWENLHYTCPSLCNSLPPGLILRHIIMDWIGLY